MNIIPSLQSRLLRFLVRRANFFAGKDIPITDLRRKTDSSAERYLRPPRGISVTPGRLGAVPGEWIVPPGAPVGRALLYIHGGGFIFCSLATHRALVARIAQAAGTRAFSVDYRLAPEQPFPAALEDCVTAYRGLLRGNAPPKKIVVAGDSAGGNLTLALLITLRDAGEKLPAGAVCLSPVTDMAWTGPSMSTRRGKDPIFPQGSSAPLGESIRTGYIVAQNPRNPLISPYYADARGLPPVLFHVGEDEVLLDDSVRMAEKIRAAGGQADMVIWKGMWHVFQVFAPYIPEANQSIRQVGEFIRKMQHD
jgi:monoterpene epsilon-lactone hydrolase